MPARSIGTATISFGLVSIPTKLYTTNETGNDIHFNMLHDADGSRLKQQYICTKCNEVVDREHTVKGFEHAKGQYVILSAEELKALDAVATQTIALEEFVPAAAVDPLWVEKSYYLGPDKGGERAYKLIHDAMIDTDLVGIASYSARGKSYIVCLRPFKEGLIMHQLRYAEEVKDWSEVPIPDLPDLKPAELGLAKQIIQQIAHETFAPDKYKDEVQARMRDLIQKKVEGQEITVIPEAPAGKVIDLMEALKASLGMAKAEGGIAAKAAEEPVKEEPKKKVATKKK
ncbi:MAG: Ku protein [Deltaproteobacteria bacterium]|nr:Ku protein [Deltaproteobacteria bacterium]MCW5805226.1 Ku protein [Deltaproteobacteria bacterium]